MRSSHHDFYRGKRVLITGGLGFIGSNLALALVELNAEVTLVDSMISELGGNLDHIASIRDQVSVSSTDLRETKELSKLVRDQDVIYSLAGQVSHVNSMRDPINDLEINCKSQLTLLESCRRINTKPRIVFSSTRQIYGCSKYLPVDEKHPRDPVDVNGIHKLAAEMYFLLYARVYQMQCVCLRLTNTYGPRMDLRTSSKGFLNVFIKNAICGSKIKIFGSGKQRRDFNFVSEVVDALLVAGYHRDVVGQSFNLGSDQQFSLVEFISVLQSLVELQCDYVPFPREFQAIEIGDYISDYSLFSQLTGWKPTIPLRVGLAETIDYFFKNPHLIPNDGKRMYLDLNLLDEFKVHE